MLVLPSLCGMVPVVGGLVVVVCPSRWGVDPVGPGVDIEIGKGVVSPGPVGWVPVGWGLIGWGSVGWMPVGWMPVGWVPVGWVPVGGDVMGWVFVGLEGSL